MKLSYDAQIHLALNCTDTLHDQGLHSLNTVSHLLFLICHEYNRYEKQPVMQYDDIPAVQAKIVEMVEPYIRGGHEPDFNLGPNWWAGMLCECFALIKHSSALWNLFDDDAHERIIQLMKMYAYMWNFGCNEENSYSTGWGLKGNYGKWRGPNYRLCNNVLILFIADFFGGIEEVNALFESFDYKQELLNLQKFEFKNAIKAWMTPSMVDNEGNTIPGAQSLLIKGGDAYIRDAHYNMVNYYKRGTGKGVKIPYKYQDTFPYGIIHSVYNNCFSGGSCVSSVDIENGYSCGIADGTISSVEGKDGMMLEFNLADDGLGRRSSLMHCATDFYLASSMAVACWFLRISKLEVYKGYEKIQTGVTDFLYKLRHGYNGWSLGMEEKNFFVIPSGLILWGNYWADHYGISLQDE